MKGATLTMTSPSTKTHTLASGKTVQSRYNKLGGMVGEQILPPERILGLLLGFPDSGKSHFVESNPDAYIFNCASTSTSNRNASAIVFPGYNTEGDTVDENNKRIIFTYAHIRAKVKTLEQMARDNEDRPTTIVFDSLTSLVKLIQAWVPDNLYESTKGKRWRELDGKMAWDTLYNEVVDIICRLRNVGYGVYMLAHLKNLVLNKGTPLEKTIIVPNVSANFMSRLIPYFELVLSITSKHSMAMVNNKAVPKRTVRMDSTIPDLIDSNTYKSRAPIDIILPAKDGWDAFVTAYNKSISLHAAS